MIQPLALLALVVLLIAYGESASPQPYDYAEDVWEPEPYHPYVSQGADFETTEISQTNYADEWHWEDAAYV